MEAVAYAVCAKGPAHEGIGEERLAADADRWRHLTAADVEFAIVGETGEHVRGRIDRKRRMAGCRDWMRRHPESRAVQEIAQFEAALARD